MSNIGVWVSPVNPPPNNDTPIREGSVLINVPTSGGAFKDKMPPGGLGREGWGVFVPKG
jgi:hypothetical protein